MGRVYGEPVNVQARKDGRPVRFVWRGRLYAVRSVMEHWVVNREWWRETGETGRETGETGQAGQAGQTEQTAEPELRFWRVEASAGQGLPSGVYELRQDVATSTWTLRRVLD
jgi:Family of unknown function (DUF6504)